MKILATAAALSLSCCVTPSWAQSAVQVEEGTELINATRIMGWIQATCFYGNKGLLTPRQTEYFIAIYMKGLSEDFGSAVAEKVRDITLKEHLPYCKRFWPREFLLP